MKIGIDFGTRYTKIIGLKESGQATIAFTRTKKVSRQFINHVLQQLPKTEEQLTSIAITGGNVSFFPDTVNDITVTKVNEWDSLYKGVDQLYGEIDCILINMGSGTSIHLLSKNTQKHIGGSALGGVTIDKLKEYFDVDDVPELNELSGIHSTVCDLVGELKGIKPDWPGVYFNNLHLKTPPEELIAALEQVIADQIMNLAYLYAKTSMHDIFLLTGGCVKFPTMMNRIEYWTKQHGITLKKHDWNQYLSLIGLVGLPNSIEIT